MTEEQVKELFKWCFERIESLEARVKALENPDNKFIAGYQKVDKKDLKDLKEKLNDRILPAIGQLKERD